MKKIPYWLKGGIVFGTISLIAPILLIITGFIIKDIWRDFSIILVSVSLFPTLQVAISQTTGPAVGHETSFLVITAIRNIIFWFLIGCTIGWIMGRIKRILKTIKKTSSSS